MQVRQERVLTGHMKAVVVHQQPAEDMILNIGQMRDARHLRRYRPSAPILDSDHVVMTGVAKEVNVQKRSRTPPADAFHTTSAGPATTRVDGQSSRSSGRGGRGARQGQHGAQGGRMVHGGRGGMRGGDTRGYLPSPA